jgi:tetratricopeptide (TPR) repeat protein
MGPDRSDVAAPFGEMIPLTGLDLAVSCRLTPPPKRRFSDRMTYTFASLSSAEFEDLARDLIGRELNLRFEAFAAGPDGGIDGRHALAEGAIILQAKHYHQSSFAALKSTMKKERRAIDKLGAKRYILVTSRPITPPNKEELAKLIGPSLNSTGDIFGPGDLNALLRKFPDVERSHNGLWIGSTAVLKDVVTEAVAKAIDAQQSTSTATESSATQSAGSRAELNLLSAELNALRQKAVDTSTVVEQTAFKVGEIRRAAERGLVTDEPLDGELNICRGLVEREQYHTALEVLKATFGDDKRSAPIPDKALARVRSLEGICLRKLGDEAAAAARFFEAARLDPSVKHLSNAVVAHLITGNLLEARKVLDGVIAAEPENASHWANSIYVDSAQGKVTDRDEIPPQFRESQEVRQALVNAMRVAGDPEWRNLARANQRLFPESDEARRAGSEAVLDEVLSLGKRGAPIEDPKRDLRDEAATAADVLRNQWFAHQASEAFRQNPDITLLQNTALGLRVVGKAADAASLLKSHLALFRADPSAMLMAGMVALDAGDDELLDAVLAKDSDENIGLRIERAMRNGDFQAALALAERQEDATVQEGQIAPGRLADMLRAATSEHSERAAAFSAVLDRYPPDGFADLILSDLCVRTEVPEMAALVLDRALTADLTGEDELRNRLAAAGMRQGRPEVVLDLLDGNVDATVPSPERDRLATAHAMVIPPRASGLDFFAALRSAASDNYHLQMTGGVYHLNRGASKDAVPWFRRALQARPGDAQAILRMWMALSRSGETARARKLLDTIDIGAVQGDRLDRLQVARLLWQTGRMEALEYAYGITARALDDPDICLAYSHLVLSDVFRSDAPELLTPDSVEPGVWVRLSRRVGPDFDFVYVDKADDIDFHRTAAHGIVAAAIGRRVGETFETVDGPIRFEWKVEELKPKGLHLFHLISSTFQDRFPGRGGLWTATIVGDDIEPILESLRQRRSQVERLQATYFENPLPLGAVASAGGGTTIDFAVYLARSGRGIVSATGRSEDLAAERRVAELARGQAITLDAYTLWILAKLKMLEAMRKVFSRILVPQSVFDEISALIDELGEAKDGRKTAAAVGDGFTLQETSAEEVAREVADLRALGDYIRKHAEVVGIEAPNAFSGETLRLADLIGNQFDCLSVAAREDGALLSADLRLRQVATEICKLSAFGLDALIDEMSTLGTLDETQRAEAVLTLCELRHSFVGLNAGVLFSILQHDGTDALARFARAAQYLGTPDANSETHIAVAASFASIAFRELGDALRAQAAVGIVLRNLVRMSNLPLAAIVNSFASQAANSAINRYVRSWLKGHFMYETYISQIESGRT